MLKGYGYWVVKTDGSRIRFDSLRKIADAFYLTVPTVYVWLKNGKVSEMGKEAGIAEILRA